MCLRLNIRLYRSTNPISVSKHPFFIFDFDYRNSGHKNGETPDKTGGFLGYIFFVAFGWSECRDSNSRPLEPHGSATEQLCVIYIIFWNYYNRLDS